MLTQTLTMPTQAPTPVPTQTATQVPTGTGIDPMARIEVPGPLLTPAEVASMFRVDPKTVTRWARAGKLSAIRTLGGHRRFSETEVRGLLGVVPQPRRHED